MGRIQELLGIKNNKKKETEDNNSSNLAVVNPSQFQINPLTHDETHQIKDLLVDFSDGDESYDEDYRSLTQITAEVKAIHNQSILLHGERIHKAQEILKKYKDGAFTAWLLATYNNRQTPYNFLQYYLFFNALTPLLKEKLSDMPKQAVYTLASREGPIEEKKHLIEKYKGESKKELLVQIRKLFPLKTMDKRRSPVGQTLLQKVEKVSNDIQLHRNELSASERESLVIALQQVLSSLD